MKNADKLVVVNSNSKKKKNEHSVCKNKPRMCVIEFKGHSYSLCVLHGKSFLAFFFFRCVKRCDMSEF